MRTISLNDGTVFINTRQMGAYGERVVAGLLPGSINLNEKGEKGYYYDLIFRNQKINVKFTTSYEREGVMFCNSTNPHDDTVLIIVGYYDGKHYFWIKWHYEKYMNLYLKEALMPDELYENLICKLKLNSIDA